MDEVLARASISIPLNSFTLKQFMSHHDGMTEAVGRRMLKEQVASGFLSTDLVILSGRKTRIYWKA